MSAVEDFGPEPFSVTRLIVKLLRDKPEVSAPMRERADWHAQKAHVLREIAAAADSGHEHLALELAARAEETAEVLRLTAAQDETAARLGVR